MFWTAFWVYCGIGGLLGLAFLLIGIDRVDEAAHGAYLVRPQLLPGLVLLWPLVLLRWIALERARRPGR